MKKIVNTAIWLSFVYIFATGTQAQKLKAEDVVAKHLESIGTPDARTALKNLIVVGPGKQKFTSTADITVNGRVVFASEANKFFLGMNMDSTQYPGQRVIFDGKSSDVAITTVSGRDFLGTFVNDNNVLLKCGLIGGTFSTGWLLANAPEQKGKLTMSDTKKIDGRDVYVLQFVPKGGSDLNIYLYIDAETSHHIRTEYKRITSAPQGSVTRNNSTGLNGDNSGQQTETRIGLTEEFGYYRAEKGIMLPHTYKLVYSYFSAKSNVESTWAFDLTEFGMNQKFDPSTFVITK